jgi:hypothetical protein
MNYFQSYNIFYNAYHCLYILTPIDKVDSKIRYLAAVFLDKLCFYLGDSTLVLYHVLELRNIEITRASPVSVDSQTLVEQPINKILQIQISSTRQDFQLLEILNTSKI